VREAHFGAVHCAIAGGFDDGEKRCEVWVCDDLIDRILIVLFSMQVEMQLVVKTADHQSVHSERWWGESGEVTKVALLALTMNGAIQKGMTKKKRVR
jgi:hypothetical protein